MGRPQLAVGFNQVGRRVALSNLFEDGFQFEINVSWSGPNKFESATPVAIQVGFSKYAFRFFLMKKSQPPIQLSRENSGMSSGKFFVTLTVSFSVVE